jgi:small-conductance mechanosensitive channel
MMRSTRSAHNAKPRDLAARLKRNYPEVAARLAMTSPSSLRTETLTFRTVPEKSASDELHRWWKRAKLYEREQFLADVTSEHRSRVERAKTQIDAMISKEQRDLLRHFDEFNRAQPDVTSTMAHPQPNPTPSEHHNLRSMAGWLRLSPLTQYFWRPPR